MVVSRDRCWEFQSSGLQPCREEGSVRCNSGIAFTRVGDMTRSWEWWGPIAADGRSAARHADNTALSTMTRASGKCRALYSDYFIRPCSESCYRSVARPLEDATCWWRQWHARRCGPQTKALLHLEVRLPKGVQASHGEINTAHQIAPSDTAFGFDLGRMNSTGYNVYKY
jgi:hypothetical protein